LRGFSTTIQIATEQPVFVLFPGGVASGKTTMRRQQCPNGYVVLDASEIFLNLSQGKILPFRRGVPGTPGIYRRNDRREVNPGKAKSGYGDAGDSLESTKAVINAMKSQCYKVKIVAVDCDVEEAQRRNANRTEDGHLGILFSGLPRALDSGSGKPKAVNYSLLLVLKTRFTQSSHHYETISDNNENVRFPVRCPNRN